eukprot:scaffold28274_cov73-Skeletonema_marinoi.AAC.1
MQAAAAGVQRPLKERRRRKRRYRGGISLATAKRLPILPIPTMTVRNKTKMTYGSENDDCEESARPDTPGTQYASFETSSYDDDCNFIGNIENHHAHLATLIYTTTEHTVEAEFEREDEEEGYKQQRQQQQHQQHMEVQEEVYGLKRQLEECTDM